MLNHHQNNPFRRLHLEEVYHNYGTINDGAINDGAIILTLLDVTTWRHTN